LKKKKKKEKMIKKIKKEEQEDKEKEERMIEKYLLGKDEFIFLINQFKFDKQNYLSFIKKISFKFSNILQNEKYNNFFNFISLDDPNLKFFTSFYKKEIPVLNRIFCTLSSSLIQKNPLLVSISNENFIYFINKHRKIFKYSE